MKIVYAGVHYDYYSPRRGPSFEYTNFYLTLKNMRGVQVIEYPYDKIVEIGKKKFNDNLVKLIKQENPDFFFAFMYTDELERDALRYIKNETRTQSLAWFADDYWRFWNYSKHWPPYFSSVVTTYSRAREWYKRAGYQNVFHSQWACNTRLYHPLDLSRDIDISFVGQWKPEREKIIRTIENAGVKIHTFGFGWPKGRVSHEEMLHIFSRSKINLNLNVHRSLLSPQALSRLVLKKSINRFTFDFHLLDNLKAYLHFGIPHTHARPFELAGCRTFVISGLSEDIGKYYREGEEMVFYTSPKDLAEKVRYYLGHELEREKIADRAYRRTLSEHTYEKRFHDIFKAVGLSYEKKD